MLIEMCIYIEMVQIIRVGILGNCRQKVFLTFGEYMYRGWDVGHVVYYIKRILNGTVVQWHCAFYL